MSVADLKARYEKRGAALRMQNKEIERLKAEVETLKRLLEAQQEAVAGAENVDRPKNGESA